MLPEQRKKMVETQQYLSDRYLTLRGPPARTVKFCLTGSRALLSIVSFRYGHRSVTVKQIPRNSKDHDGAGFCALDRRPLYSPAQTGISLAPRSPRFFPSEITLTRLFYSLRIECYCACVFRVLWSVQQVPEIALSSLGHCVIV